MAKPRHAEHALLAAMEWPERIEICRRCRRGVIVYKGRGVSSSWTSETPHPECPVCSEDEPGEPYGLGARA